MSTYERVKKLFLDNFDCEEERLIPGATVEGLGLDSLDKVEFMFALEKEFDIRIPDREVTLESIQDIIDIIDRLVAEQHATTESGVRE